MLLDLSILKQLTELNGVAGDEDEVRDFIKSKISEYTTKLWIDNIGNLIAYKKGTDSNKRIMLSAHMDEVGFMAVGHNDNGTIRFKAVGGIDDRILISKRVVIGTSKVPGVIGYRPIHLQEKDEKTKVVKIKQLYIDIGALSKDEAKSVVKEGDFIAFSSDFVSFGEDSIKAKALDDRVGCHVLMEILKGTYKNDLYACFTVQEEVGLRGSKVSSFNIRPDAAIVVEGTTCSDVPGVNQQDYSTRLGGGAALTIMDRTSYSNKQIVGFLWDLAKKHDIEVQYKQTTTGGNDAGSIHLAAGGIPTASVSVPCRYIHSPVSVMSQNDYMSCESLVRLFVENY